MPHRPLILLVDDTPINIMLLADALHSEYRIKVADNGEKALEIAQSEPGLDLILLDVVMPGIDGFEVCRRLKENPDTTKIPVIFITAKDSERDEEYGLNLGAVDYITKPISISITRARIRNHLQLKKQADMLESLALIDALTGIPNRRRFDRDLMIEWKRASREKTALSLLMIDIDHFKGYNDHYGHGAGDLCLQSVATALSAGVSRPGDLVARYGGEEFTVLLPGTDSKAAMLIAERLLQNIFGLQIPHAHSIVAPYVTVSIGCKTMLLNKKSKDPSILLQKADELLYQAKHEGRNRVCQG